MNSYSLQMPDILDVEKESDNFGTFVLQPLERGFGVTIGNSFRRVLLFITSRIGNHCGED